MKKVLNYNFDIKIINNGFVMCKNIKCAEIKYGKLIIIDEKRCPVLLKRTKSISAWLEDRACDSDRVNIKVLKKKLKIEDKDDCLIAMYNNAMNLTDGFWFKHNKSSAEYEKLRRFENSYGLCALNNIYDDFKAESFTYELTNTGAMEKCWNYQMGKWNLIKKGTNAEIISECVASRTGEILGMNVVQYENRKIIYYSNIKSQLIKVSSCKNFTSDNVYFESMYAYIGEDEDYKTTIDKLREIEECDNCMLIHDYLSMLALDYIVYNIDRHTHNYGLLKNFSDGKVISMAPAFDFNLCLTANNCFVKDKSPDFMLKFVIDAVKYSKLDFKIKEADLSKLDCDENIKKFIINNYENLKENLTNTIN